jgi:hypothetical protein
MFFDALDAKFPHHKLFIYSQLELNVKIKFLIAFAALVPAFALAQTALPSGVGSTGMPPGVPPGVPLGLPPVMPPTPPPEALQNVVNGVQLLGMPPVPPQLLQNMVTGIQSVSPASSSVGSSNNCTNALSSSCQGLSSSKPVSYDPSKTY